MVNDEREMVTHLERLGIPVLDPLYGGHVAYIMGEVIEFSGAVRESNWEFLFPCRRLTG